MFERPKFVIRPESWCGGRAILYEDKLIVDKFCRKYASKIKEDLFVIPAAFGIAALAIGKLSLVGLFVASLFLVPLTILFLRYKWFRNQRRIFDFGKNQIYRDYRLMRIPEFAISEISGVFLVSCVKPRMTKRDLLRSDHPCFYKIGFTHDRFGWGIPISGPFDTSDILQRQKFEREVLTKFVEAGVPVSRQCYYPLGSFIDEGEVDSMYANMRKNRRTLNLIPAGVKIATIHTVFELQERNVPNVNALLLYISLSIVTIADGKKEIHKRRYGRKQSLELDCDLASLFETLPDDIFVVLIDDRFQKLTYWDNRG